MKAVFLDRDGVINEDRRDYVRQPSELRFLPGVDLALRRLAALAHPVIVVTNQSAIGRGLFTADELRAIHDHLRVQIARWGGRVDAIFVCPHHPADGCPCRKPRPGLLIQAADALGLCLKDSYMVGDAATDVMAALAVGCQPVLVRTGRGSQAADDLDRLGIRSYWLVDDLAAAVAAIRDAEDAFRAATAAAVASADGRGRTSASKRSWTDGAAPRRKEV